MSARTMPIPLEQGRATCVDPQHLPLVDAAYDKPGGPEAQQMKQLCRGCPVRDACATWAMTHGEAGIWGGTTPTGRGKRGAPKRLPLVPDYLHGSGIEGTPAQPWRRKAS